MPEFTDLIDWMSRLSVVGFLVLFIIGLLREDIVLGRTYRRDMRAKDEQIAFFQRVGTRTLEHTGRVIGMVEQVKS